MYNWLCGAGVYDSLRDDGVDDFLCEDYVNYGLCGAGVYDYLCVYGVDDFHY